MIVLPEAQDHTIVCSFIRTKHRNVTDGQTDRNGLAITARLHCEQCRRAVKIIDIESRFDRVTVKHYTQSGPKSKLLYCVL